jgi:RNA polymerase sigma factor (TIGR02999 family)
MDSSCDLTLLLHDWYRGDRAALDKIIPHVYAELRRLAHIYMVREQPGHILQTTALIHEAFLRLVQADNIEWQNRAHFFAISANLMRRVLVEFARSRGTRKRSTASPQVSFDESFVVSRENDPDLIGVAIFWRFDRGRNGYSPGHLPAYRHPGLEICKIVATA